MIFDEDTGYNAEVDERVVTERILDRMTDPIHQEKRKRQKAQREHVITIKNKFGL